MTVLDTLKPHLPLVEFFPVCLDFEQDDGASTIFFFRFRFRHFDWFYVIFE